MLRGTERTATVTALTESEVYAIEPPEFVAAVTGHSMSQASAARLMEGRLEELERTRASTDP